MTAVRTTKHIPLIIVIAIFLLWITPGLVGRDLWKADEPYSFGMVNHIVKTGDLVVPVLAGEPFMEKPPLFFLTAAGFARLCSPWMKLHDAARLASALYMFLAILFTGLTARELIGKDYIGITMVVLIGSTGIQEIAHKLITDVAMIAGLSIALYGLAVSLRRYVVGGILIGTGAGIGFLSKGLLAPGFLGIIALVLPAVFSAWRRKTHVYALLIAFAAALPWFVVWPLALYMRSPDLFNEWFWIQNVGRFLSNSLVGQRYSPAFYLIQITYIALPALPIALWAIWLNRRSLREHAALQIPLMAFLVMLIVLSLSSSIRSIYGLPMIFPLALLAAAGADSFPDRAKKATNWFSIGFLGFIAFVLWVGWIVMVSGFPSSVAHQLYRLQPDYMPIFNSLHLAVACLYTLLWLFAVICSSRFKHFYLINWTAGIVLTWGLLMTLWLPWFDAGSGYRSLFTSLREKIPVDYRFVMTQGVGESERALLEYYTGVLPRRIERYGVGDCDLLLIQSGSKRAEPSVGPDWHTVWEQSRPSKPEDQPNEIFTLLQRRGGKSMCR